MKRIYLLTFALLISALVGCQKEPSTDDLYQEYMVYTAHDTKVNFNQFKTYFLPDSILMIGNSTEAEYWKDENAQQIIREVELGLDRGGFTRTQDKSSADVGVQLSYVKRVTYFVGYDDPYWWWYYPFYWSPGYWGDWLGWYYPYTVAYGFTQGSMLIEMGNLQKGIEPSQNIPIVWDTFLGGLLTSSTTANVDRLRTAIRQAFDQSPYLNRKQPKN